MLINLNPAITELAKNLILSGVNLILFDKRFENTSYSANKTIKEEDYRKNYLFREEDKNQNVNI